MPTFRHESRAEYLTSSIAMLTEGLATHTDEDRAAGLSDRLEKQIRIWQEELDLMPAEERARVGTRVTVVEDPMALHKRPAAGSRAANQYGEFVVKYATPKQVGFIKHLLESRNLAQLANSQFFNLAEVQRAVAEGKVNKRTASAAIDRLLQCPELDRTAHLEPGERPAVRKPASEKQVALIKRLAAERFWFDGTSMEQAVTHQSHSGWFVREVIEGRVIESRDASGAIDFLFGCGKRTRPVPAVEIAREHTGPWVQATSWNVYRVYYGRQSGNMLAKVWNEDMKDWDYAGRADRFIDPARDHRMTRDEAAAWGQNSGNCCVCGAELDDPESIDRGIGPVCWGKMA